jgi:long-chain acyl-CoA synthetase
MLYDCSDSDAQRWLSLVDLFEQFAQSHKQFLQYDNGYRSWKYSYAQVGDAARCFAARLDLHAIRKGDKVIIFAENRPEWIAAFWGCVLDGAIVVPIDYRSSAGLLRRVQEIVGARAILIGDEVQLPAWERQPLVWRLTDLDWTGATGGASSVRVSKDDVAEVVFTSGATGEPKGVLITHRNILANMVSPERIIAKYGPWFRPLFPLRFLSLIPLSHMFGQAVTTFIVPLIPAVAVFIRGYSAHEMLRQIRGQRVSVVIAVPKLLEVLREHVIHRFPEVADDTSSAGSHWIFRWWRYRRVHRWFGWKFWAFIVGAAPLPAEIEKFWSRLGFAVIQGYGLTETAPIVAFNDPFDIKTGTVGRPVTGLEVRIAADGEILVRGESVTTGYYQNAAETDRAFEGGWFHTGDIGEFDEAGRLTIRGRKKEVIVTPEGLKVFPEDVELVLNRMPGVRESAVVGKERVHAVLVLEPGGDPKEIARLANLRLEEHQKIRGVSIWPGDRLPRTEGTQKIKHGEIQRWVDTGGRLTPGVSSKAGLIDIVRKYAPGRAVTPQTTLDELGLSSLDRVQLMMDLEERLDASLDESMLTGARTVAELAAVSIPSHGFDFPAWNRSRLARMVRGAALAFVWLPLTRLFAHLEISGKKNLTGLTGPVIFVANHQSHLDTPSILAALPARYRYHVAVAMWKEYFDAHFFPERHSRRERFLNSLTYWLVALFFNAFPLPQTEAGAGQSLRYIGELVSNQWSILFFPEGQRTEAGEISTFQQGIGLMASRLGVPVLPIRLRGLDKVLHRRARWPRPGRVELAFGPPLHLNGQDYAMLAKRVEEAVTAL